MNYYEEAKDNAKEIANQLIESMIEQLNENGELSTDLLNDYPDGDSLHYEIAVDAWYSLSEAAGLLDELREFEETDSGLWEGQPPREAISTQAAFTMGSAVFHFWGELIERINSDYVRENSGDESDESLTKWVQDQIDAF